MNGNMQVSHLLHLLHRAHFNYRRLDGQRCGSHGYGCLGDRDRDGLALLVSVETGLGDGVHGGGRRGGGCGWRWLCGQGELEERQRDCLLLHTCSLSSTLLFPCAAILHPDAGVHGLVAPQVVAVLELLVAGGADVWRSACLGQWFYCKKKNKQTIKSSRFNGVLVDSSSIRD